MEKKQWNRAWNNSWNNRKSEYARSKPDGGFCFIPAMALIRAWRAYKDEIIRLYDLRVWFACFELVARRCEVSPNRFPRYTFDEVHRLVGGRDPANVQTAVRRLINAGLLDWSERSIRFPAMVVDVESGHDAELLRMIDLVKNNRRKVPVPRRTLRFLAGLSKPVSIATVLGHLLRCLYYRNAMCVPDGRCKASWVADAFGVDVRNVKNARRRLCEIGWIVVETSHQTALNRWGAAVRINLLWKDELASCDEGSPPPAPHVRRESPPPRENRKLSSRIENQKPAIAARNGAYKLAPPSLRHVRIEDLHDVSRIDGLLQDAWNRRLVPQGEAARLRFHSAAVHALRVGQRNPAGVFVVFIRRGLWSYLSSADEDMARQRLAAACRPPLRGSRRGVSESVPTSHPMPARVILEGLLPKLRTTHASAANEHQPIACSGLTRIEIAPNSGAVSAIGASADCVG